MTQTAAGSEAAAPRTGVPGPGTISSLKFCASSVKSEVFTLPLKS